MVNGTARKFDIGYEQFDGGIVTSELKLTVTDVNVAAGLTWQLFGCPAGEASGMIPSIASFQ